MSYLHPQYPRPLTVITPISSSATACIFFLSPDARLAGAATRKYNITSVIYQPGARDKGELLPVENCLRFKWLNYGTGDVTVASEEKPYRGTNYGTRNYAEKRKSSQQMKCQEFRCSFLLFTKVMQLTEVSWCECMNSWSGNFLFLWNFFPVQYLIWFVKKTLVLVSLALKTSSIEISFKKKGLNNETLKSWLRRDRFLRSFKLYLKKQF